MTQLIKTDNERDVLDLIDLFPVPIINHDTDTPSYHFKMPDWPQGGNWRKNKFNSMGGTSDWDVILSYLRRHSGVKNSYIAYCSALEKLILFLLKEKRKMISELSRQDFEDFYLFLAHPEPANYWVGDRHRKFDMKSSDAKNLFINPDWKPFVGKYNMSLTEYKKQLVDAPTGNVTLKRKLVDWGMGEKSIVDISVKVATMFRDLFESGYFETIPIIPRKVKAIESKTINHLTEHFLEKKLIQEVIEQINSEIEATKEREPDKSGRIFGLIRDRFIIKMFFTTGLRIFELADLKVSSITNINKRWVMNIMGKGDKPRQINLHKDTLDAIKEFRSELGAASPLLLKSEKANFYSGNIRQSNELDWAMVPQINLKSHICPRRIDQLIKPHFELLAELYKSKSELPGLSDLDKNKLVNDAYRLESASAHWLRHSHGTYFAMECNQNMKAIMERLGHSKADTTAIYLHVVDKWFGEDHQVDYSVSY